MSLTSIRGTVFECIFRTLSTIQSQLDKQLQRSTTTPLWHHCRYSARLAISLRAISCDTYDIWPMVSWRPCTNTWFQCMNSDQSQNRNVINNNRDQNHKRLTVYRKLIKGLLILLTGAIVRAVRVYRRVSTHGMHLTHDQRTRHDQMNDRLSIYKKLVDLAAICHLTSSVDRKICFKNKII